MVLVSILVLKVLTLFIAGKCRIFFGENLEIRISEQGSLTRALAKSRIKNQQLKAINEVLEAKVRMRTQRAWRDFINLPLAES